MRDLSVAAAGIAAAATRAAQDINLNVVSAEVDTVGNEVRALCVC